MNVSESQLLLTVWLRDTCALLADDAVDLSYLLVTKHKITNTKSLHDVLKACPDFLSTDCELPVSYNIQIKNALHQMEFRALDSLSPAEVGGVFRKTLFNDTFADVMEINKISGFMLSTLSTTELMKFCGAEAPSVVASVLESLLSRLKSEGVPAKMLEVQHKRTAAEAKKCAVVPNDREANGDVSIVEIVSFTGKRPFAEIVDSHSGDDHEDAEREDATVADDNDHIREDSQVNNLALASVSNEVTVADTTDTTATAANVSDASTANGTACSPLPMHDIEQSESMTETNLEAISNSEVGATPPVAADAMAASSAESGPDYKVKYGAPPHIGLSATYKPAASVASTMTEATASPTLPPLPSATTPGATSAAAAEGALPIHMSQATTPSPTPRKRARSAVRTTLKDSPATFSANLQMDCPATQIGALSAFIRLFPAISPANLKQMIECGVVRRLFDLASTSTNTEVAHLAIVALNHVISTRNEEARLHVFSLGASRLVVDRVRSGDAHMRQHAMWLAGDLACYAEHREVLVRDGLIEAIVQPHAAGGPLTVQQNTIQAICNIMRGRPMLPIATLQPLLTIAQADLGRTDCKCVVDALAAVYFFAIDETAEHINHLFSMPGLVDKVVQLLKAGAVTICTAAEKVVEILSAGTIEQTKVLIALNLLPRLKQQLGENKRKRVISGCRTLCNICAGDEEVLEEVLGSGILSAAVDLCRYQREDIVQIVVTAVCYALSAASDQQTTSIVAIPGSLPLLCTYLKSFGDSDTIVEVINAVFNVLIKCESIQLFDAVIRIVYDNDGWLELDELRSCRDSAVRAAAMRLDIAGLREGYVKTETIV